MKHLVFLLEELSARDLLERQLVRKVRGWQRPGAAFVVLRDQDSADCHAVKDRLTELVDASGRKPALVRVACRELESWVVGDWHAVAQAFERPHLAGQSAKAAYKDPDQLVRPVESLRRFIPDYQKRSGARRVGRLLDPQRNHSKSFRVFCAGIQELAGRAEP